MYRIRPPQYGHSIYQTYRNTLLARYESWWTIRFIHRYGVHPNFSRILKAVTQRYIGLSSE